MTPQERWLAALWPFIEANIPPAPAGIFEVGCGPLGGFVPNLRRAGYDAVGIDPEAPAESCYERVEFERYTPHRPAQAVIASTSLHHVDDVDDVVERIAAALVPGGVLVVVEWDWERFDEVTARWGFGRLPRPGPGEQAGWLHRLHDQWIASGQPWEAFLRRSADERGLHPAPRILRAIEARFSGPPPVYGPYLFSDLAGTSEDEERTAIDAGHIQPTGLRYTGRLR